MKKALSALIVIVMVLILVSCGDSQTTNNSKETSSAETVSNTEKPIETFTESQTEAQIESQTEAQTEPQTEASTELSQVDIDWTEAVYTVEDNDGYRYEISFKLSPWILVSNSDIISSAWQEIGENKTLPLTFEDWGLKKQGNTYKRSNVTNAVGHGNSSPFGGEMTDMYYCLGTFSVKNVTEGWSITESSSRSITSALEYYPSVQDSLVISGVMSRVFYNSEPLDYRQGIRIVPSLNSDTWGPCPFVVMSPENISPKYPNGNHYESLCDEKSCFRYVDFYQRLSEKSHTINGIETNENICVGVIGKNGEYVKH